MKKQVYVLVVLKIIVSENTFYDTSVHTIILNDDLSEGEINEKVRDFSLEHAKGYTDNLDTEEYHDMIRPDNQKQEVFFFNGSELSTQVYSVDIIPKEHYNILMSYLI